jgi:MFS superfamily sulfate permease-like transporter
VTSFIAKPVLRGFAFGLALTIILKQVASVVGVH